MRSIKHLSFFKSPRQEAFTLVEIVLVLVMLGFLMAISTPHFRGFFDQQELKHGSTFLKGTLNELFSQARSEPFITGLVFDERDDGEVRKVVCDFKQGENGPECGSSRTETLLLWEEKPLLKSLNLKILSGGEVLFTPPHGDILMNTGFIGNPEKLEIPLVHASGNQKVLQIYRTSGLINILDIKP